MSQYFEIGLSSIFWLKNGKIFIISLFFFFIRGDILAQ